MEDFIQTHLQGKAASFVEQADVIIAVQGTQFLAHTALLSSESPVLADILHEFVATADTKKAGKGLPVLSLWSDSDKDCKSPAGALASLTAPMFEQMLNIIYNPYNFFVKHACLHTAAGNRMDRESHLTQAQAEELVPIAHLLQMETLLQVCDQAIADSLALTISWGRSRCASWGNHTQYGRYVGEVSSVGKEDHRWLEFGMKYDLPSVMAVALSSALKKVVGGESGPNVGEHVVLEFLGTLTPAVKGVVLEEMVAYTRRRDEYRPDIKELAKKLAAACKKSA